MPVTVLNYHITNCYLLPAGSGLFLVDADMAGTLPRFFRSLGDAGMRVQDIRYLLCTHYDPDHAGIAQEIRAHGVDLVLPDVQVPHISRQDATFRKDPRVPFTPVTAEGAIVVSCAESRAWLASIGIRGEILHTPGHSDDSVTLIVDEAGAFVGDLPRLQDVPAWDDAVMALSWRAILRHDPPTIYPGHGSAYAPLPDFLGS